MLGAGSILVSWLYPSGRKLPLHRGGGESKGEAYGSNATGATNLTML